KEKVEGSEDLTEDEASEIIDDIEGSIVEIEQAKEIIISSDSDEEIKEAAQNIKNIWSRIKNGAKVNAGKVVNSRVGGILIQTKQLETKLNRVLEQLAEQGINTDEASDLVDAFNAELDSAISNYETARELFVQAKEDQREDLVQSAHEALKKSKGDLNDARVIIRDIVVKLKDLGGEDELEEDEILEEIEEELEDESE
ncbi:hypothetical protein ACFL1H_08035, partial [Nanoarchaeota archaeon]